MCYYDNFTTTANIVYDTPTIRNVLFLMYVHNAIVHFELHFDIRHYTTLLNKIVEFAFTGFFVYMKDFVELRNCIAYMLNKLLEGEPGGKNPRCPVCLFGI